MGERDVLRQLRRDLWQPPRRHGEINRERSVGTLELFYDLVVVVLVAQAGRQLSHHLTWGGVGEYTSVFGVIWLVWFNGTLMHELHGREDLRSRMSFLVQILVMVPLGAFVPDAGNRHGRAFAITAAILLLLIAFLWWRISLVDDGNEQTRPAHRYILSTCVFAVLVAASVAAGPDWRVAIWVIASVAYLAGVATAFSIMPGEFSQTIAITDSLVERFGLLVIIVLGETVTGVVSGLSTDPADPRRIAVGVVCVVVGFGSWWTYFDFIGARMPRNSLAATTVWLMAHLPVSAAIAMMGAAMPSLIEHATSSRTPTATAWIMCGGAAGLLLFTIALMASLDDRASSGRLLRSLAAANTAAAAVAIALAVARPTPLVLVVVLVVDFGGPWTLAVVRRAILTPDAETQVVPSP